MRFFNRCPQCLPQENSSGFVGYVSRDDAQQPWEVYTTPTLHVRKPKNGYDVVLRQHEELSVVNWQHKTAIRFEEIEPLWMAAEAAENARGKIQCFIDAKAPVDWKQLLPSYTWLTSDDPKNKGVYVYMGPEGVATQPSLYSSSECNDNPQRFRKLTAEEALKTLIHIFDCAKEVRSR